MRYEIRFVEAHQLPAGHDWMLIETPAECVAVIRGDAVCPTVLSQCWAAYRATTVAPALSA